MNTAKAMRLLLLHTVSLWAFVAALLLAVAAATELKAPLGDALVPIGIVLMLAAWLMFNVVLVMLGAHIGKTWAGWLAESVLLGPIGMLFAYFSARKATKAAIGAVEHALIPAASRRYTLRIYGRGEDMTYRDAHGEITLQRTGGDANRLYCSDTAALPFARRKQVVEDLCDYFETLKYLSIFVLDEADKDRGALEDFFAALVRQGHKVSLEYDSAEKREHGENEMYLGLLRAGKKLKIDGVEIATEEDFWRWRSKARQGAPGAAPTFGSGVSIPD